jgi:CheY-like chemotaxis protein
MGQDSTIKAPLKPADANAPPTHPAASLESLLENFKTRHGRSPRTLIVDDEQDICELLTMQVENLGLEVLTAANGRLGLGEIERAVASGQLPDMILTDLNMPLLGGVGLARQLRMMPSPCPNIPIVLLSGNLDPPPEFFAEELKSLRRLSKPFERSELRSTIQECLEAILAR